MKNAKNLFIFKYQQIYQALMTDSSFPNFKFSLEGWDLSLATQHRLFSLKFHSFLEKIFIPQKRQLCQIAILIIAPLVVVKTAIMPQHTSKHLGESQPEDII